MKKTQLLKVLARDGGKGTGEIVLIARERYDALRRLVRTRKTEVDRFFLDSTSLRSLPLDLQAWLEYPTTVRGSLQLTAFDDMVTGESGKIVTVESEKQRVQILLVGRGANSLPINATVVAEGMMVDSILVVSRENLSILSPSASNSQPREGPFRVLILLTTYPTSPPTPFTREDFERWILSDTSAVRRFFRESSYGRAEMTGDVYGWLLMPQSLAITPGWSPEPAEAELSTIVQDLGIDLARYDNVAWIQNVPPGYNGPSLGRIMRGTWSVNGRNYYYGMVWVSGVDRYWTQGGPFVWTLPAGIDKFLCHELGHNMNLDHADLWDWRVGRGYDAQNPFDVMGYLAGNSFTHNAAFKSQLGWLDSAEILTIKKTGNYFIRPLEAPSGVRAAVIKASDTVKYGLFVENRGALGFERNIDPSVTRGILVNVSWGFFGYEQYADMMRTAVLLPLDTAAGQSSPVLTGSQQFTVPGTGVTLGPIVSLSDSGIVFHVTVAGTPSYVENGREKTPDSWELDNNYPNPFNPSTTIRYIIPFRAKVTLSVYDVLGREVARLVDRDEEAGTASVQFDAVHLSSGVYFYRLVAGSFVATRRMMLIK